MSGIEIERKFLVKGSDYKKESFSSSRIKQGYICSGYGHTVRVRIRGDKGYITIKGASDEKGMSRYEFEKEITLEEAAQEIDRTGIDASRFSVHDIIRGWARLHATQFDRPPDYMGMYRMADSFADFLRSLRRVPYDLE